MGTRRTETCVAPRHVDASRGVPLFMCYCERSELLIDGDGKKIRRKKYATPPPEKYVRRTQKNVRRSLRRAIASAVHAAAVGSA